MKKLFTWKYCIFGGISTFGLYIAGIKPGIIGYVICFDGLLVFIACCHKEPSYAESIYERYGGKEVEIRCYDGTRYKGKVSASRREGLLSSIVLMEDVRITNPEAENDGEYDDDDMLVMTSGNLNDEAQIEESDIKGITCTDLDKIPRR